MCYLIRSDMNEIRIKRDDCKGSQNQNNCLTPIFMLFKRNSILSKYIRTAGSKFSFLHGLPVFLTCV